MMIVRREVNGPQPQPSRDLVGIKQLSHSSQLHQIGAAQELSAPFLTPVAAPIPATHPPSTISLLVITELKLSAQKDKA